MKTLTQNQLKRCLSDDEGEAHPAAMLMIITANNFISWQVAAWFAVAGSVVGLLWWKTKRVPIIWFRVYYRAAVVAFCFTPLPHLLKFLEEGTRAVTPLWYALYCMIIKGDLPWIGIIAIIWFMTTYFLWVAGMSVHHLLRNDLARLYRE